MVAVMPHLDVATPELAAAPTVSRQVRSSSGSCPEEPESLSSSLLTPSNISLNPVLFGALLLSGCWRLSILDRIHLHTV